MIPAAGRASGCMGQSVTPNQPGLSPVSGDTYPPSPTSPGWSSPANPHLHYARASHKAGGGLPHPHPITTIPQDPSAHQWEQAMDTRTREPFVTLDFCPGFCLLLMRVGDQLVPNISAWAGELHFSSAWQTTRGAQRGIFPSSVSAHRTPR